MGEVNFTLWALKGILEKMPFDNVLSSTGVTLNFSATDDVPHYVKKWFVVKIIQTAAKTDYEACCCIRESANGLITIIVIMKKEYDDYFRAWANGSKDEKTLAMCCIRRALYCHEACHIIAILRAFPHENTAFVRDKFFRKLRKKFDRDVMTAEETKSVHLGSISEEILGVSPSEFDEGHFGYGNDGLKYRRLYPELLFSYDKMVVFAKHCAQMRQFSWDALREMMFVSGDFFYNFPSRLTTLKTIFKEMFSGK